MALAVALVAIALILPLTEGEKVFNFYLLTLLYIKSNAKDLFRSVIAPSLCSYFRLHVLLAEPVQPRRPLREELPRKRLLRVSTNPERNTLNMVYNGHREFDITF